MSKRRSTSLSLDEALLDEAKALGLNVSRSAEAGIAAAVKEGRATAWLEENREALKAYDEEIARNGLPLEKYRQF
jgi:antitoxin CcdA